MDVTTLELKFLLRLLAFPGYRTPISQIKINPQTKAPERDRICHSLCSKGLVDFTGEVKQFSLTPAGRTLLGLDTSTLPVTPDELLVLRACTSTQGLTTPSQVSKKVPAASRQRLIQGLEGRGLLKIRSTQVKEVWLTAPGKQFLLTDCTPQGTAPILSLSMLGNYVQFLRQTWHQAVPETPLEPAAPSSADDVLESIIELDQRLAADNYLPIFRLREALQPPLSRDALDQLLYQLQREDRIEFSTLQDVTAYSRSQIEAGISQDIGGALFFISVIG
ncbi:hypothetical protein [Pseudanabaena sp. FACHB-2040]|uniref:hypothetical protein n=1 Tax=Pseudanabaena sp. FACHB-2040 TaxID=2692859 RepID=UPI001687F35F|nr:hypothetical protein [Pseudanabaena sp. FACHB-2040]MBD2259264.1 hypothetical protein [Pseudanabaena sp. FACHB-2040]